MSIVQKRDPRLKELVEQRQRLDEQIATKALEASREGVSLRVIGDALGVAPSTALEFLNRAKAMHGASAALDDVVVVAAKSAYDLYLGFGVYACQVGRRFRNAEWMGFYLKKTIQREFARILHIEQFVQYTDTFIERIAARGGQYDEHLANVVRQLRNSGERPAGGTNEIVILSSRESNRSLVLDRPIIHTGYGAWTQSQRYVSSVALRLYPATTAELARLMTP
jgi:hypothetical protein